MGVASARFAEPDEFYRLSAAGDSPERAAGRSGDDTAPRPVVDLDGETVADDELLLERIVELEALLEADRARKPKFQKPKLQQAWAEELASLNRRMDS